VSELEAGVVCGHCGGPVYFETCPVEGHDWALAGECQRCGYRSVTRDGCLDCKPGDSKVDMGQETR
jgi:hypothetical protein